MFTTYIVVTVLVAADIFSATIDFIRFKQVLLNMTKAGVLDNHAWHA